MNLIRRLKMTFHNNFVASIKANDKILREIDNQVILPFQTEYSILLKNLESRKASVTISIDGQDVLYGKSLLLNPNTSIELERFVDNITQGSKFKFIKKTQEISDYRGDKIDDGLVRVEYRFEKYRQEIPLFQFPTYPIHPYIPSYPWITYCNNNVVGDSPENNTVSKCINNLSHVSSSDATIITYPVNSNMDDGITVQGSKSEQQFSYGSIGELEENSYIIIIGLKGSDKIDAPITVKTKLQCPTCGKTSKDKFCGNCGTSLEIY